MFHIISPALKGAWHLHGLTGSVVGHRSIVSGFKPQPVYVRKVFHHSLCLMAFGGHSAHLAYVVYKSLAVKQQDLKNLF